MNSALMVLHIIFTYNKLDGHNNSVSNNSLYTIIAHFLFGNHISRKKPLTYLTFDFLSSFIWHWNLLWPFVKLVPLLVTVLIKLSFPPRRFKTALRHNAVSTLELFLYIQCTIWTCKISCSISIRIDVLYVVVRILWRIKISSWLLKLRKFSFKMF